MIEYEKDKIVHSYITEYIQNELVDKDDFLKELEEYATANHVPIVPPETASFLSLLVAMNRPVNILEVGCAIGYSAILMARQMADGGKITTLEYNKESAEIARENIKKAGLSDVITVVDADAKEYLHELNNTYDFIFLDGPKGHYIHMLDDCIRLLSIGGVLVADNVLYKGMVANNDLLHRRKITIVKRLRMFITALNNKACLKTSVIPIGDGMTVSVKIDK